jgi:cardiolipin synthase A/B
MRGPLVSRDLSSGTPPLHARRFRAPLRAWAAARALDNGVRDVAFRELLHTLDDAPHHEAPPVRLLADGAEAFRRMHDAIGAAREEVLLETYILRDDRLGDAMQRDLMAAAARGVRVSVLADAVGSFATRDRFWDRLSDAGVTVRRFHRFWHHPLDALRRDHRKLLVVDRRIAFTGGMNVGEEYGSSRRHRHDVWRDTFIELSGSVAQELAAVFAEGWDRARGPALPGLAYISWADGVMHPPAGRRLSARALRSRVEVQLAKRRDRRQGRRVRREFDAAAAEAASDAPLITVLDPRPGRGQREMLAVLAALVGAARERLWITTPYFAPPTTALRLLVLAANRGVDVRLLLPSARTDMPLIRHAAHGAYAMLLRHGVRIFEYERAMLHAKTMVVDGYATLVGSSNLDFRSFWLNAECNVLVLDHRCGDDMDRLFAHDLTESTEITAAAWQQRPVGHRLLDAVARSLRWAL